MKGHTVWILGTWRGGEGTRGMGVFGVGGLISSERHSMVGNLREVDRWFGGVGMGARGVTWVI